MEKKHALDLFGMLDVFTRSIIDNYVDEIYRIEHRAKFRKCVEQIYDIGALLYRDVYFKKHANSKDNEVLLNTRRRVRNMKVGFIDIPFMFATLEEDFEYILIKSHHVLTVVIDFNDTSEKIRIMKCYNDTDKGYYRLFPYSRIISIKPINKRHGISKKCTPNYRNNTITMYVKKPKNFFITW
jgi:hypothetical protein